MSSETWQLSMGAHEYTSIIDFLQKYELPKALDYPKGKAVMKNTPQIGDKVIITCKAKEIATGVIAEGFHTLEGYSIQVATVLVEAILYKQHSRKGQRRNWTKMSTTN